MAFWQANHGACSNPGTQVVTQNKEFGAGTHANLTRALISSFALTWENSRHLSPRDATTGYPRNDVWETQRAKKVVSDGPGLVDFAIGASDFCS